jgi:hypothetical protein
MMSKERWREELAAAASEKDILNVVRDYVALLSRDELELLPGEARPGIIRTAEEISEWAVKLVRDQLAIIAASAGAEVLRDLCEFFAAAAAKMVEVKVRGAAKRSAEG